MCWIAEGEQVGGIITKTMYVMVFHFNQEMGGDFSENI